MRYPKTLASCPGCDTFLPPKANLCPSCGLDASVANAPVTRHSVSAVALLGLAAAAIAACGDDGPDDSSSMAAAYGAGGTFDVGAGAASSEGGAGAGGGVHGDGGAPGTGGAGGAP